MLYKLFVSRNFLPGTISLHVLALGLTTFDMKHLTNHTYLLACSRHECYILLGNV
jgi:hypothetical protein